MVNRAFPGFCVPDMGPRSIQECKISEFGKTSSLDSLIPYYFSNRRR
jgi:hypothetical protein